AAERNRQLGESGAAAAGAAAGGAASGSAAAAGGHDGHRHGRHRPRARAAASGQAAGGQRLAAEFSRAAFGTRTQRQMTAAAGLPRHRGVITASVVLGSLLYSMDWTIGVVALPHMQGTFSATQDQISWVITSYIVASAIMIPTGG